MNLTNLKSKSNKCYVVPGKVSNNELKLFVSWQGNMLLYDSFYDCHYSVVEAIGNWLFDNCVSPTNYSYKLAYKHFEEYLQEVGSFCGICNDGPLVFTYDTEIYPVACLECGHTSDIG